MADSRDGDRRDRNNEAGRWSHDNRTYGTGRGRGRGRGQGRGRGSDRGRGRGFQGSSSESRGPSLPLNPSNLQFVRSVLKTCPNHKLQTVVEQMDKAWLSSWQGIDALPLDGLKVLLSALSRLPYSVSIAPPPLSAICKAVSALLGQTAHLQRREEALDGNDETLEIVELVERVVQRLLKFTWDLEKDDVKDALDGMIADADTKLNLRLKTHRPIRDRLSTLLTEMDKSWTIKVKRRNATHLQKRGAAPDWRHPTVAWLVDYKHFQPTVLPKLQHPRTGEGRVYESSDEYFTTIVNLWIGMTFVEGNNALLPHCTVRMGDSACDQPLWPFPGKQTSINCRNSQCNGYATFVCAHRQHVKGYCTNCANEYQRRLRGPPSKYASTHIYDGKVSQVKYDGTIRIEQVASRRPPLKPIHWKTTKRLSSPNLVGVVRLGNREASLRATDEIYWAEIIFQGKSFDEFRAREQGCLTFRLLQYLDTPGNAMLTHNPAVGDAVAIIDCQTFVPEFIPVLKALEMQRQMPVPFQNGALLNLCDQSSLGPRFDGERFDADEDAITFVAESDVLIRNVIQLSLLDPIVDIRRDEALRCRLETSLECLVRSASLDPGQLKSFTEALMFPVHCTQGPPGTGKSYLGVVVVRALLIIRDVWKLKNREIGDPPILVLSYKNHAIDEFLLDLLRSEPTLNHTSTARNGFVVGKYYLNNGFKKLVRIGGGCSEPELEPYRERNVAFSDPRVRMVSQLIEDCQGLRDQWHQFRDCFSPITEAQTIMNAGAVSLSREELISVQNVVAVMVSAVAMLLKLTEWFSEYDEKKSMAALEVEAKDDIETEDLAMEEDASLDNLAQILAAKPKLVNDDIVELYNGIKHYDSAIDPTEVLYQWLLGFIPLPVCAYDNTCSNVRCETGLFCLEHSCQFSHDGKELCLEKVVHKQVYCTKHLCVAEECSNCRINDVQLYCDDHACFVCLVREAQAKIAVEDPPRNTCDQHPLCWRQEDACDEVAEPGSSYCKMHASELFCKWDEKCTEIATTGRYCSRHHAEAMKKTTTEACAARTRKGRPCKAKALTGSTFCRDHVGKRDNVVAVDIPKASPPKLAVLTKSKSNDKVNDQALQDDQSSQLLEVECSAETKNDEELGSLCGSDSDLDAFEDAISNDNGDEVEESEHLQHLRDVYEVEDDSIDLEIEVVEGDGGETKPWVVSDEELLKPDKWHWKMSLDQRWNALVSVLSLWSDVNTRLQGAFVKRLEDLKIDLHRELLRANSRVYEGKSVIGGTITGCVSRLEAIRTTNPFAILVEEASEVMEPLLVSCFSSSTQKLEMIGDHLQLQPSVMGRIDFERVNKINISMFERLISAPHDNQVPSSVLSIQRRMRKSICDLTRSFYDEITVIEDHEVCGTKVLGGTTRRRGIVPLLDACEGRGREVPGVSPHIFFWTHSGKQERASVGLSRVNHQEAKMTCQLVKYLVHCGVPATSIAVLTPYKGQLMLMRKKLMDYGMKKMTKGPDSRAVPSCFLSTVDRFQGDEADIVIVSLVIDGKSRTPFVKLQNRMIVLLSRARLGLYVVGNVEYFGETPHWQKTLCLLEKDAESDSAENNCVSIYTGRQIGPALPICCPEHRSSVTEAKDESDLKLGFCTVVCSTRLSCSHECGLLCHWPQVSMHNTKCNVEVQSRCSRHPQILKCSTVTALAGPVDIDEALVKYQCPSHVDVAMPCGHRRAMKCYAHADIEAGRAKWPVCNKEAVAPYVYPICKHIRKCTCSEFDRFSKGHAPLCSEKVDFTPPCDHIVTLLCHDRQEYIQQTRRYVCQEKVNVSLPRCGHETTVPCPTAEALLLWTGNVCPTLDLVQEEVSYGPKDYFCKQKVKFQRRCGHFEMVRCERAFELAESPSRCKEPVVVQNPECGHECSMACFEVKRLQNKVAQFSAQPDMNPVQRVCEGDDSNYRNYGLLLKCSEIVTFIRACGHTSQRNCSEARHVTTHCDEIVTTALPLCGHMVRLPCHSSQQLSAWQPWEAQTLSIKRLHDESIFEDTVPIPTSCPTALRSVISKCSAAVRYRRVTTCGHEVEMKCCDAFELLHGKKKSIECRARVVKQLKCGHEVPMTCSDDQDSVICHESVTKQCWNFATCCNHVSVSCKASAKPVSCLKETTWRCPISHSYQLPLCSKGIPSDCPGCSKATLDFEIKLTQRILSDQMLFSWSFDAAPLFPDMDEVTSITISLASKKDFLIRKVKLLENFKRSLDSGLEWQNPLFKLSQVPFFVILNRKLQGLVIEKFEMQDFGSLQTFNGIEVYEATQDNFERVVNGSAASLLFGQLYTLKALINPVDIPKTKDKKGGNIRTWINRQSSNGYDAMYRDARGEKKGGTWIVWNPHAMLPLYRVELTKTNREKVMLCLPKSSQLSVQPRQVFFKKPSGVSKEDHEILATKAATVISNADIHKLRDLVATVSPYFEKLNVWHTWEGQTLSTGAVEAIPQRTEKTLASKLCFVPMSLANSAQQRAKAPFGGYKYVQLLQSQGKLKEDGDLFIALELLTVRKQDVSESRSKLESYVTRVCGQEGGYAHPLVIVAIARLAARLSKTPASEIQRQLLEIFTKLFPAASSVWLTEAEIELVRAKCSLGLGSGAVLSSAVSLEDRWENLKSQYGCRSEAMDELLNLVGLKKVKHAAVNLFRNAMILQQMTATQRKKNTMSFNYCFVGNPGTGKTTVARLFANVLKDSRLRSSNQFVECTAQQLKDDGAAEFRLKLKKASGGVLFIDEAYELDPVGDFKGKPIVAELLTAAEDKRDVLSIILAGYHDDIQKKLYAYNDGLPSRFEEVVFEDFDAHELEALWDDKAQDCGWEYEQAIAKVACRRLAKAAGRKGFGNARAVRKLFEQAVKEAMAREDFDGQLKFQTVDLLGDRPSTNPKLQAVLSEVEEKTGWQVIKQELRNLVRVSDENYERELKGQETVQICLNRLFLGNPGTGKTTCAGFYGRILKALHFLSNGDVVKKTAGDFIGQHVGESQTKTAQILDMSKGKVVVIDEAYNLNDNMYGKQVLDVLVEKVQGTDSDDIAVVLIGYKHEMLEMLRTQNPGLTRRFPLESAFNFEDYTAQELLDIVEWNCAKRSLICPHDVAEALLKKLALQKTQPHFGNAGAVEQLLKQAAGQAMRRPMVNGMTVLTLEDIGMDASVNTFKKDPISLLNDLYRMDAIKEQLIQLQNQLLVADREGWSLPQVGHFVFRGSPGTGKTTVARVMAEILHGMGVLASTKLVETSGLDLTGQYVGQTKEKVTQKLGDAKGGLLFIDEAYMLGTGTYGEEAMTTLVAAMTDPSYVGMVIIVAGYPKDMDEMLDRNVGLKSRFTRFIDFADWEAQDAVAFLGKQAETENFEVTSQAVASIHETFVELKTLSDFGNGRDAVQMWKTLLQCRSQRVVNEPEEERTITDRDAEQAGEILIAARRGGGVLGKNIVSTEDPLQLLDHLYRMDQIRDQLSRLRMEMVVAKREGTARPNVGHFVFRGSPGTGKTTVARVMAQILHAMGALASTKLVETSGLGLTGEYLGQTKKKVTEKLVEAKGGLLFIDEAYELGKGQYGEEAMTTLVAAMTDPKYMGLVLVIAGYPKDMDVMLNRNAGLKSRFTRFINFPDWEAEDGVAFLQGKADSDEMKLGRGSKEILYQLFMKLKKLKGFGNGRDADHVWKELLQSRAQRVFNASEDVRCITAEDAVMARDLVLAARRPPDGPLLTQKVVSSERVQSQNQEASLLPECLSDMMEWQEATMTLEEDVEEEEVAETEETPTIDALEDEASCNCERDPGVSDEDWEELERAKAMYAAHLKSLKQARDEAKLAEERRRVAAIQEKIRQICPCPAGFQWFKNGSGWRCGGGSHFVSDAQLNSQFTC
ncbi:hypothetical protein CCR75_007122 [Bremia lactucae]|uniref:SWIM-type domain-containing protein n=1 Tax=Bremia lactucae TaxID=4779 RepID=A0A976FG19_BRELC|nr:hypothetical protein CCR75_007122 [Bremia lactucae]